MSAPTRPPLDVAPAAGHAGLVEAGLATALLAVALAGGWALADAPTLGLLGAAGLLAITLVAAFPTQSVIAFVALTPLIVGLDRGAVVPHLRLHEVLLAPLAAGLALVALHRWWTGVWRGPVRLHLLDGVVLAVAISGSATTLLWMYARGQGITGEDLQYALQLWKLVALYGMVRAFVREADAMRAMLTAVVVSAVVVGAIGALQTVGFGPVLTLLSEVVSPGEDGFDAAGGRATSTVGNPHAFGDVLVYAAVVAGGLAVALPRGRVVLAVAAAGLGTASLSSGSFSTALALGCAAVAFAVVTRTARWLVVAGVLLAPLAYLGLRPVVEGRLSALDPATGLPVSWTDRYGRLDNLQTYFWPRLAEDFNWLLGVRPASRVPGEVREYVYIESGWTWALWNGGVPLLVGIVVLLGAMFALGQRLRRTRLPEHRALGVALTVLPWVLAVLMFLDPHLTIRGGAEIFFVLVAMGATADPRRPRVVRAPRPAREPEVGPVLRRRWPLLAAALVVPLVAGVTWFVVASPPSRPAPAWEPLSAQELAAAEDALHRRSLAELEVFTDWLERNDAEGYIGEVGIPGGPDVERWTVLGQRWFEAAADAGLWVDVWSVGEWWGQDYVYAPFGRGPDEDAIEVTHEQGDLLRWAASRTDLPRGVNLSGGEFGAAGGGEDRTDFSNAAPGRFEEDWHYDGQESLDYLAEQGVDTVRLPFRWERIQPVPGEPLDRDEVDRIRDVVGRADAAGLRVILDVHNFGAYHLDDGGTGVRRAIGSPELPVEQFADLWRRLSEAFDGLPGVLAYDLMNEPVYLLGDSDDEDGSGARLWESVSQAAVDAIRDRGDETLVMVPGYHWSHVAGWAEQHPRAWIDDPADNIRYAAHHYWSPEQGRSYDEDLAAAIDEGY